MKRLWCFIVGHDMISRGSHDNGRSKFGDSVCMRCGYEHYWQYDYGRQ